jgi:hypothetical protein
MKSKYKMAHPIIQMLQKRMLRDLELQILLSALLFLYHNQVS